MPEAPNRHTPDSTEADDAFLIRSMLGGDSAALRRLMDRYDRLVRYTIYRWAQGRCQADPHFLESVASDTWTGFVRSMQRGSEPPRSVRTYLIQTARNRCISALRAIGPAMASLDNVEGAGLELASAAQEEPAEAMARIEEIETLRGCVAGLDEADQKVCGQLGPITERRWQEAAAALGVAESTLRSRWGRILDRLRSCMKARGGEDFSRDHRP